ncbi:CocE/NonD family hydrolase [Bordetella sp. N]|uniref:CocE/NonD family hydrolase n=1 Tax=Bordetella sp. N TaxID=1746199 RepID=UPI00070B5545|nr:CocE/NonD family hydrolase [Bordetella sp. N]ALM85322.1 hydrolase [Bordetella sp. N]
MSDFDYAGQAWHRPPSAYAAQRARNYRLGAPSSCYVTMDDGCRLAVDVYLPEGAPAPAEGFASIVVFTPYNRRFKKTDPAAEASPNSAKYRDYFVPYGYAVVVVDLRGTGASFGRRIALRSPKERDDARQIADWIVAQTWSSGIIGATGISYLGAAACFLASTGHPAVKAIAPLFAVSDIYNEQLFPGGMLSRVWSRDYDELMVALDQNDRVKLARFPYFNDPRLAGPQPVDEDADGALLAQALLEHRDNFRLHDMMPELAFRDEGPLHAPELRTDACSPFHYLRDGVRDDVAIYSVSGWYDGGSYANGAITRFLSVAGRHDRLLLGPWDHGARTNVSPWRDATAPSFALMDELLRFFDTHLLGMDTGIEAESAVHYFCIHDEQWRATDTWPPLPMTRYDFTVGGGLVPHERGRSADGADVAGCDDAEKSGSTPSDIDTFQVRFDFSTGLETRWRRLGAHNVDRYYGDWQARDRALANYTSAPFDVDTELSGHIEVVLDMASSERDAALFVYAAEIESDGSERYITEGMLRALHRATRESPPQYRTSWPYRSYYRADARLLEPGQFETLRFALFPISWMLRKGSRLRLSVGGADAEYFPQVPHGAPPRIQLRVRGATADAAAATAVTHVLLPIKPER